MGGGALHLVLPPLGNGGRFKISPLRPIPFAEMLYGGWQSPCTPQEREGMASFCCLVYLAGLVCLYTVLSFTLGLKGALLVFGAVHLSSGLLLVAVCWGEIWGDIPARMERTVGFLERAP
jgi:hypothetical protein